MRHTRGHTRNRRSHHALTGERLSRDVQTGSVHLRHHVDMTTGMYRGRKVFENPLENAPARSDKGTQPAAKQTKKETKEAGKAKAKKK